jgi:transposase
VAYVSGLDELSRDQLMDLALKQHEIIVMQEQAIKRLTERVEALEDELEKLRSQMGGGSAPEWVKPNRKERREQERSERKKRKKSFVRPRETPTEIVKHAVESCPDCGRPLGGGWLHRVRQVIDIPQTPVRVVEHQVIARRCGVCGRVHIPKLDLSKDVLGKHRVGVRLMSLIAKLHTECRVPLDTIRNALETLYCLRLSKGELSEILHTVAKHGQDEYAKLLADVRGSPVAHADETGWREDGLNGYIWSFSTPKTRFFVYNRSRASDIPKQVLGDEFSGVLVCDFYSAYGVLLTRRQRCWVHFLRDLRKLKDDYPKDVSVEQWVNKVIRVYRRAKKFKGRKFEDRLAKRTLLEEELLGVALPYVKTDLPQHVLAERIERFLPELFVFVEDPRVPSSNNAAERSVRPSVIARKISGGTRSAKGSATKMTLMSLFGSWKLRGLNTLESCRQMLLDSQPTALQQST